MKNSTSAGEIKKLVSGTAVLTASAVITKIIGLFYKIPLIKYVGIEGMAYFLAANHIYIFLFVISTSGLPVAVSIMVSKASVEGVGQERVADVFRAAINMFLLIGSAGTLFMLFAANGIAQLINISGAARCICAIAPSILIACVSGAYRGYFQGRQIMKHTAVSQVIEAFGKLFLGLAGAVYALRHNYDTETIAAFAIAGITAGVALSMLYLIAAKAIQDHRICRDRNGFLPDNKRTGILSTGKITGNLFRIALPITLSSAVISLTGLIDTTLIANCLANSGFSASLINRLYSSYGNIAIPLFALTPALIAPVSIASVPMISAALKSHDRTGAGRIAGSALRLTLLAALPASVGLSVFAEPIIRMIFPYESLAAGIAAPLLSLLALSVITACLITTTNALLQANGKAGKTIISMLIGAGVKILSEYLLLGIPAINIAGAPISTFLCNLTVVAVNFYFLYKCMPSAVGFSRALIPAALSALASVGGAVAFWRITDTAFEPLRLFFVITVATVLYIIMAFLTGAITPELTGLLPGGKKISARLYAKRINKI